MSARYAMFSRWAAASWAAPGILFLVAAGFLHPLFSPGLPPGVDSPTFLHFVWLYHRAWVDGPSIPLWDPYWYGGMDPFFTYSPLGFLATAVPAAALDIDPVLVYKLWLLAAVAATGLAVYWLARELGMRKGFALGAALLAEGSYPLVSSIGLWGRFTTVLALPVALFAILLLERGMRRGKLWYMVLGGIAAGVTLLVHHMTGFVLLSLIPFLLVSHVLSRTLSFKSLGVFAATAMAVAGWWLLPFLSETRGIGFTREDPGLWVFGASRYLGALLDRGSINSHVYPSYFGIPLAVLALWSIPLVAGDRRMWGYVAGLAWLLVLSLGSATPVGRAPVLASLDAARFHLYMVPFAAVLSVWGMERTLTLVASWRPSSLIKAGTALIVAALVLLTGADAYAARGSLRPYRVAPEVQATLTWLRDETAPGRVFAVGFWHWDAYLLPAVAGRESVTGWYIEGARRWREVRPLDMMAYSGKVDLDTLYRTLREFDARYVILYDYNSAESPEAFEGALTSSPLFRVARDWGSLKVYEVLP